MRAVFIGFFFIFAINVSSYGFIIKLYDEIGYNEKTIPLKKIAQIIKEEGDSKYLNIDDTPILELPKAPKYMTAKEIFQIIKKKYRIEPHVVGSGVKIYPLYTILLDQEIAEKIKTQIYKIYPTLPQDSIEVMYVKNPKFPKVPAGDLDYKILVPGGKIDATKYVRLQIQQDKTDIINMSIPIKIIFQIPTWKSKKSLKRGTILQKKDFNMSVKSTLQFPEKIIEKSENFFGKKLLKSLKPGENLNYQYIF